MHLSQLTASFVCFALNKIKEQNDTDVDQSIKISLAKKSLNE